MGDLKDVVLSRLIAADPRLSLEETLRVIVAHAKAGVGGVFVPRGGDLDIEAACGVSQEMVDRVRGCWTTEQGRLAEGRPVYGGTWCVWPIAQGSGVLLVYLGGVTDLQVARTRDAVEGARALLIAALRTSPVPAEEAVVDRFLETTPRDAIERRQLLALLSRHEWNISRVARALGCNRVTVYKRMQRLGVPRVRVSKGEGAVLA